MEAILLGVQVFVAIALIGVVLIQRSSQDGFGLGSGSGANFMSGRQSANLLTRITAVLAAVFMLNSLVLTILAANRSDVSIVDRIEQAGKAAPVESVEDAAADAFGEEEAEALPDAPSDVTEAEKPSVPIADEAPEAPTQE